VGFKQTPPYLLLARIQPRKSILFLPLSAKAPRELRLLWVVPIGYARSWPKAKPRRSAAAFTHMEGYDVKKVRRDADIHPWPKN